MKYFIASDIHGSAFYCRQMLEAYKNEGADLLILLGDILYHGPRNALPKEYDTSAVYSMLNELKDEIICVRGNCDAEVDQWVLAFPMMDDYKVLEAEGHKIYLTHGHKECLPKLISGDIVLSGHTHVPKREEKNGVLYLNPGSVSIPKEGSAHSYMIYEKGSFIWKDLD